MRRFLFALFLFVMLPFAYASNEQRDLQAAFLAKFAQFIEWPDRKKEKFTIVVIDENPFGDLLERLYKNKKIKQKPVEIRYVTSMQEINDPDLLFITIQDTDAVQKVIEYAKKNSILTISEQRGFAQRGGMIQLSFVARKPYLVINYDACLCSNLKVSSSLLAIASKVIKKDKR